METYTVPKRYYEFCLEWMPRPCVDLVFLCGGEVLLLRRQIQPCKGEWALPGGGIEKGFTVEQMAIKKAQQETGIVINEGELQLVCATTYFFTERQDVCITFKVRLTTRPRIILDYQHDTYGWFARDKLPEFKQRIQVEACQ